jgi:hypothetical protein
MLAKLSPVAATNTDDTDDSRPPSAFAVEGPRMNDRQVEDDIERHIVEPVPLRATVSSSLLVAAELVDAG